MNYNPHTQLEIESDWYEIKSRKGGLSSHSQTQSTMKKLSETLTELGIAFSFPIEIKDANGKETYYEDGDDYWYKYERDSNGYSTYFENSRKCWYKYERDSNGKETYFESSTGVKRGTPKSAKTCEGKVVEVDGIKYELKAL